MFRRCLVSMLMAVVVFPLAARAQQPCNNYPTAVMAPKELRAYAKAEAKRKKKKPKTIVYRGVANFGASMAHHALVCVVFEATIFQPFLDGLKRVPSPAGAQYYDKQGNVVTTYPDSFHLTVVANPIQCTRDDPPPIMPPGYPKKIHFGARWIGPVARELGKVHFARPLDRSREWWTELSNTAGFFSLQIPATGIPLSSELEIDVYYDNMQIACLTGNLESSADPPATLPIHTASHQL